jgi:hypothetical protein
MSSTQEANSERHYLILIAGVFIGVFGVYFRFADDPSHLNIIGHISYNAVANIIMCLGIVVTLKGVFDIMK